MCVVINLFGSKKSGESIQPCWVDEKRQNTKYQMLTAALFDSFFLLLRQTKAVNKAIKSLFSGSTFRVRVLGQWACFLTAGFDWYQRTQILINLSTKWIELQNTVTIHSHPMRRLWFTCLQKRLSHIIANATAIVEPGGRIWKGQIDDVQIDERE